MPATPDTFEQDISRFIRKAKDNTTLLPRLVAQEVNRRLVHNTPVVTGNLVGSWYAAINGPPSGIEGAQSDPIGSMNSVANTLSKGQRLYVGNVAPYARRVEYGFVGEDSLGRSYNQPGRHFVSSVLNDAPNIARQTAARLVERR